MPWARPAGGKGVHRFTPPRQAQYMGALKLICAAAMKGAKPIEGPVLLEMVAYYAWPKSVMRTKLWQAGCASSWRTGRPDIDNLMKLVGDALNGVAWIDDAQIAVADITKKYGDMPRLQVRIETLG